MSNQAAFTARDIADACDAWGRTPTSGGGTMSLSLWLLRHQERKGKKGFSVADYAALLALVRAELDDTTDYAATVAALRPDAAALAGVG